MSAQTFPRPRVRFSLLWKITLPFMFLAMVLGLGATYLVNRFLSEEQAERFLRQLVDSGQQATDAVVRAEIDLLSLERLIANTEGVSSSAAEADAENLRARVLPLVVNAGADVVAIVDSEGTSLLTVRREPAAPPGEYDTLRGETYYAGWPFVQRVLEEVSDEAVGDKHAGLHAIILGGQESHVFFVAGPLYDPSRRLVGAVLVGEYLQDLATAISTEAGANVSAYDLLGGSLLGSTLEPEAAESILIDPDTLQKVGVTGESPVREIRVADTAYWEILTPFVARQGTEIIGVLGVSLIRLELEAQNQEGLPAVVRLGAIALALIVIIGLLISSSITRPLVDLVEASSLVAMGNLDTMVPERGSDEIGALSKTFNRMVEELREGSIYRDLLGRTVTPEVREQLRTAFSDGGLLLRGQATEATILFADFRGYTAMAERTDPAEVMKTLNDYFSGVVPIISLHGGVVNKFDGDSVMAFFGILPQYLPPKVSALQATHAGIALLEYIDQLNADRDTENLPAFEMGIGVATGEVIAGGLGSEERVHYTVVGDTVNTAQRIQQISYQLGGTALLISEDTFRNLGAVKSQFRFGRKGLAQLKGKQQEVMIFEVIGRTTSLVRKGLVDQTIEMYTGSWPRLADELTRQLGSE